MKKTLNINGKKTVVDYESSIGNLVEDKSRPSTKYSRSLRIERYFEFEYSINSVSYNTIRRFTQDGGPYAEAFFSPAGWVSSEKKLAELTLQYK